MSQLQFTADLFAMLLWVSGFGLVLGLLAGAADMWLWMRARRLTNARRVAWTDATGRVQSGAVESIFHSKQAE
jgi:hypothetical protein